MQYIHLEIIWLVPSLHEPGSSADDAQPDGPVPVSSMPSHHEPGGICTADLTPEPDFIHIANSIEDKGIINTDICTYMTQGPIGRRAAWHGAMGRAAEA